MHICGIIAEYNPFHGGHAYQIAAARRQSGCDYVIAVMSGDFVQRGAPAIMDKYTRARMALENGADLVLMLPVCGSTASAEGFARTAVAALRTCGIVDTLSFGCEDPAICSDSCRTIAAQLNKPTDTFSAALSASVSAGTTYAAARVAAIRQLCPTIDTGIFDTPNNLLAFEYLRALELWHSDIRPIPVKRLGGYHDAAPDAHTFASASACRTALLSDQPLPDMQLSDKTLQLLHDYGRHFGWLCENDCSAMLHYALLSHPSADFSHCADVGADLSARITNHLDEYESFSQFCALLKNKSMTYARISRALTHILLQLPAQPAAPLIRSDGTLPYLRVLGFRSDASGLMHALKANAAAPLITRPAQAKKLLTQDAVQFFSQDLYAADICRSALLHKGGHAPDNDCRRRITIV